MLQDIVYVYTTFRENYSVRVREATDLLIAKRCCSTIHFSASSAVPKHLYLGPSKPEICFFISAWVRYTPGTWPMATA